MGALWRSWMNLAFAREAVAMESFADAEEEEEEEEEIEKRRKRVDEEKRRNHSEN